MQHELELLHIRRCRLGYAGRFVLCCIIGRAHGAFSSHIPAAYGVERKHTTLRRWCRYAIVRRRCDAMDCGRAWCPVLVARRVLSTDRGRASNGARATEQETLW